MLKERISTEGLVWVTYLSVDVKTNKFFFSIKTCVQAVAKCSGIIISHPFYGKVTKLNLRS